jgi:hypothetical protein
MNIQMLEERQLSLNSRKLADQVAGADECPPSL